jgi:hypothetical protein
MARNRVSIGGRLSYHQITGGLPVDVDAEISRRFRAEIRGSYQSAISGLDPLVPDTCYLARTPISPADWRRLQLCRTAAAAGSTGRRNTSLKFIRRSRKSQRLPWTLIQTEGDPVEC